MPLVVMTLIGGTLSQMDFKISTNKKALDFSEILGTEGY